MSEFLRRSAVSAGLHAMCVNKPARENGNVFPLLLSSEILNPTSAPAWSILGLLVFYWPQPSVGDLRDLCQDVSACKCSSES